MNLIPTAKVVGRDGAASSKKLESEGVTDLGIYRGAYDVNDKGWPVGSDWMPYGIEVPATMAQSEQFAKKVSQPIARSRDQPDRPAERATECGVVHETSQRGGN